MSFDKLRTNGFGIPFVVAFRIAVCLYSVRGGPAARSWWACRPFVVGLSPVRGGPVARSWWA